VDVSEYRRQVEAEVEQAASRAVTAPGDEADLDAAATLLRDPDADPARLRAALQVVGLNIDERPELFDLLLELLQDTGRPLDQRLSFLGALQEIALHIAEFPAKRPGYLEALRAVVDDPSAELRRAAIGALAREKDEYVQRRLLDGLEGRSKALVRPAEAIALLGYDVHAEHVPLLRRIVADPPNRAAKIEALRVLGADPSSRDLLLKVMEDKGENPVVRRIAAVALEAAAPGDAHERARRIALDDEEDAQMQALAINWLSLFADPSALGEDEELDRRVERLRSESRSRNVKRACAAYLARRGPASATAR
jgi:hypothetical protein